MAKKLIGRKTKLGRPAPAHRSNLRGGINYGSILIFLKFNIDLDFEKVMKVMKKNFHEEPITKTWKNYVAECQKFNKTLSAKIL